MEPEWMKSFNEWMDETSGFTEDDEGIARAAWKAAWEAAMTLHIDALDQGLRIAHELILHGDFRNGVTDSTGTIDEGEARAGMALQLIESLLTPQKENE